MFENTPDAWWWIAGANLTKWIDWDAWGAIGTVGALWYAAVQSFRSSRFERMRAAAEITAVLELIGPVTDGLILTDDGQLDKEAARHLLDEGIIERAISGLQTLSLPNVPDTSATSYLAVLRLELPALKRDIEPFMGTIISPGMSDQARNIAEAYDYLHLLRRFYTTGSSKARAKLRRHYG